MESRTKQLLPLLCTLVVFLMSCNKMDENGLLDGNWQLTEWRENGTDNLLATNQSHQLYYTVKLDLIKFQIFGGKPNDYVLAYFQHKGDSLVVTHAFSRPFDDEIPLDSLERYGCPPDGRFYIQTLTHSHMSLSSAVGALHFRKY